MALTADQKRLDALYKKNFGKDRSASFGTVGGADYWLSEHKPQTDEDWANIDKMLYGSDEGQKHRGEVEGYTKGKTYIGGIDETKSIESQSRPGFWGDHFREGSTAVDGLGNKLANMNAAAKAQAIADKIKYTPSEDYFNNTLGGTKESIEKIIENDKDKDIITTIKDGIDGIDGKDGKDAADGWWTKFADAEAFKKFLDGDSTSSKSDGMGDFMKFMMLMSVMGGGRGMGGGGYSGSQFGYGGLNAGGVQAAYDPMKHLTSMGTWFKDNFGSGSSSTDATTQAINAS